MPRTTDQAASDIMQQVNELGAAEDLDDRKAFYRTIVRDGLWNVNPGLVQLLGLCPLLAISNTTINALGLGLATLLTLIVSNTAVSAIRAWLRPEIRIPAYVLLIASIVTVIEMLMNAWLHDLYLVLGIFLPLIVTNCMIIGRAESFASRQPVIASALDGAAQGTGFMLVLVTLGAAREALGHGTLLRDAHLLLGSHASDWTIQLWDTDAGLLIALLPPGAFIGLGLLLAVRNLIAVTPVR